MSNISTNTPPQHSTFGMVVGNTSMETLSFLTQASTTHGDGILTYGTLLDVLW